MSTLLLLIGVFVRQIAMRGRILAIGAASLALIGLALITRFDQPGVDPRDAPEFTAALALTLLSPLAALVFASASIGENHYDGTLVYLWLRPLSKVKIAFAACVATAVVTVPIVVAFTVVSDIILGATAKVLLVDMLAVGLATATYAFLFTLLSLMVKNAIIWGVIYVLIWEGVVSTIAPGSARVAIRNYSLSIIESTTPDLGLSTSRPVSTTVASIVMIAVCGASVAALSWMLSARDIR